MFDLYTFYNPKNQANQNRFIVGESRPIGIHFGPKYSGQLDSVNNKDSDLSEEVRSLRRDIEAIRFLLRAVGHPPYLQVFDQSINASEKQIDNNHEEDCCVHLMIMDVIQMLNPDPSQRKKLEGITNYRAKRYADNKGFIRLPIKRPVIFPAENQPSCPWCDDHASNSHQPTIGKITGNKQLIITMGGAEQNYAVQTMITTEAWKNSKFRFQFSENLFERAGASYSMSTESLVHSVFYDELGSHNVKRIALGQPTENTIRAHVYLISASSMDFIGICGYSAMATKIIAMCLVHFLSDPKGSSTAIIINGKTQDAVTPKKFWNLLLGNMLLLITATAQPDQIIADVLKFWDNEDVINHTLKFEAFISQLRFELLFAENENNGIPG